MGDAIGGTYELIGRTKTDDECVNLVKKKQPQANAATRGQITGPCYAGFGATATDKNSKFRTCIFKVKSSSHIIGQSGQVKLF